MILVLLPFLVNGAMSLAIMREMRRRGLEVVVAYYFEEAPGYTRDACDDFAADGCLVWLQSEASGNPQIALTDLVDRISPGLILQIGAFPAYPHLPSIKEARPGLQLLDTLYNPVGHTVNYFLFEACFDGVIVESEQMRSFVAASTFKEKPNIELVESGVDLQVFSPRATADAVAGLTIGYVGRLSPEKNPLGFVDMAEKLAPLLPGARFRVFGEGQMADELQRRIAATGLGEVLSFDGYVPHVLDALHQLDVLVVCSKLDGRPNVVMEANGCGVPVVGAPVGGIPELIEDGHNGHVVHPGDFARLHEVLAPLHASRDERREFGRRARETAERRFDRRKMMDAYEGVFRRYLARAGRA